MKLEILGGGCANCDRLLAVTQEAVSDLALEGAEIVKVQDMAEIVKRGVMSTPALAVEGKVVSTGRVPDKSEVMSLITTALAEG